MQAKILILCGQCNHALESINIDIPIMVAVPYMALELLLKINKPILAHREKCSYYSAGRPVDPPCSKLGG